MNKNIWRSDLLNKIPWLAHGTSTRVFGSLRYPNVGEKEDMNVQARTTFVSSLGLDPSQIVLAKNVHGNRVEFAGTLVPSDGLITDQTGLVLATKSADCLPIFFVDPTTRKIAIVHAGWKGVMLGIAIEAVHAFQDQGSKPKDLLVAIGPSIGVCHYGIDQIRNKEMMKRTACILSDDFLGTLVPSAPDATSAKGGSASLRGSEDPSGSRMTGGKMAMNVNLRAIVVRQLISTGILPTNIDSSAPCTACHTEQFFSYHITRNTTEQMLSVISFQK